MKIPIVLGVVGHRKLRPGDVAALRLTILGVLNEFRTAYPDSPLVLLSALAPGADQLAVEAALELKRGGADVVVRAPLPFPTDVYAASTSFGGQGGAERTADEAEAERRMRAWVGALTGWRRSSSRWRAARGRRTWRGGGF